MFKNYFKMAFRNLVKYPGFSALNIAGLTLGISASFVILMYVWQELQTDKGFKDYKQVYRIGTDIFNMGGFANSQEVLHEKLMNYKSLGTATVFQRDFQGTNVEINTKQYTEPYSFHVDSNYFKVFSYQFLQGSPQTILRSPNEVVLTEKLAKKYFGNSDAIGKVIKIGKDKKIYRVAAIVADNKDKTHLLADLWTSLNFDSTQQNQWNQAAFYNYIKLSPGVTKTNLKTALDDILLEYVYPASGSSNTFAEWKSNPNSVKFFIQPLKDIYLYSNYKFEISPGGNPAQIYALAIIGIFIILIASANFINLTTARSSLRAKEVGIKKTLGATKKSLVTQFLLETIITSVIAMAISVFVAQGLIFLFELISQKPLLSSLFTNTWQPVVLFAFVLLISLLAGIYPAFYLTSFIPKKILKGDLSIKSNKNFRNSLVVFQFTLAIALIIATIVMYSQLNYMRNKNKGFDENSVLVINDVGQLNNKAEAFRQAIAKRNEVVSTSFNSREPAGKSVWMYTYLTTGMKESRTIQTFPVDEDYIPTLGMHILSGRNFSKEMPTDSSAAILNESAVRELGLKNPIGAQINHGQKVIGVVSDFNFESLKNTIAPVVMIKSKQKNNLAIKLNTHNVAGFLTYMQKEWKQFDAADVINYSFLDENFAALAAKDRLLSQASTFFTILALIIASIGLFALVMFTVGQRTKEIGIRKIMGADASAIVFLLSRDFLKLVIIAFFIGSPLAWLVMHKWLQDYAYRVHISWWMFVIAGLSTLLIAIATISFQAIKAAIANPVESLRSE